MLLNLLRSLIMTCIAGFMAPIISIGALLAVAFTLGYLPGLGVVGEVGVERIVHFLKIFGSGNPTHGIVLLGSVGGIVGVLFDTYAVFATSKSIRQ